MAGPETVLAGKIRKAIRARWPDAWTFNVHGSPYQTAGVPDLLVCVGGRLIAIEIKCQRAGETVEHARGRTTPRQDVQIGMLHRAGAVAGVAISVEEALELVAESE